ncbi:MAG TPA: S53 family peptidase [Planctomycetaceae bacterium]|jgi:kumamolisin|nr:S53 family peptidase [Planctomycetaceae bacterium]
MATASKSYLKHQRKGGGGGVRRAAAAAAKSYIEYPKPLRSLATSDWRVADLCAAYDIPKGTCPGGGVIGILELGGGYTQGDLDKFSANNGLPRISVTDVSVSGGTNSPGSADDGEVLLDIQVAAAVYYYATGTMPTIKMFWAPNDFKSFEAVVDAAVDAGCDVLSISWGSDEKRWEQSAPGAAKSMEDAVLNAVQKGLAVFAAAGDNASGDGGPGANVDMPSSCPHIIGCGGTTKFEGSEETVWGNGNPNGEGTGGGYSNIFPMPPWESSNGAPPGSNGGRMVPDVAADADPQTGYLVVINGVEQAVGGTSAVAPFYSGLFAAFGKGLGFVGETLWKNPKAFTDIVTGSNGDFSAAPGPDPCTGLGVPIGSALAIIFAETGHEQAGPGAPSGKTALAYGSSLPAPVVTLQGQRNGVANRLSGASYTGFATWHGNGQVKLQINDPNITADSRVFASPCEYATDARINRFIGSAQMAISNIAPANGSVQLWLNVNWGSALNVRVDYFVDPQQI